MNTMVIAGVGAVVVIAILFFVLKGKKQEPSTETTQPKPQPKPKQETKTEPKVEKKPEPKKEEKPQTVVPRKEYPNFNINKLKDELGLDDESARMFIDEFIKQADEVIEEIKKDLAKKDTSRLESLTHTLKGSATNLRISGVADVLVDFNTYLKSNDDIEEIELFMKDLEYYLDKLKKQFK